MFEGIELPKVYLVRQKFNDFAIGDIASAVRSELEKSGILSRFTHGMKVAITVGSRGIDRIDEVIKAVVENIKLKGGKPFLLSAMGSHGGGTIEGQLKVLSELHLDEKSLGVEVKASDEFVEVARTICGAPVFVNRLALDADAIFVVNRVKPHSSMSGAHQSGIVKMLVVGLGGTKGARALHGGGPLEMARLLPLMAEEILVRLPIIGGVGLVENAYHKLAEIRACLPDDFLATDRELLKRAMVEMPTLPFDEIDVLVVEEIGKDISGVGMEPLVIGRRGIRGMEDISRPRIRRIVALSLSEGSGGNAHGVGLADIISDRLKKQIDWDVTLMNAITTGFPEKSALPISFPTDREAIACAIATCWAEPSRVRLVKIKNTRDLEHIFISPALLEEARGKATVVIEDEPVELVMNREGANLS